MPRLEKYDPGMGIAGGYAEDYIQQLALLKWCRLKELGILGFYSRGAVLMEKDDETGQAGLHFRTHITPGRKTGTLGHGTGDAW